MTGLPENMQRIITPRYEQIVNEIDLLYHRSDNGLLAISQRLGVQIMAPNKKINILLIGNHSAGKSSLINWYIEDNVQRTGVAIETQGISIIQSGKRRETLMGPATLHLFPYLHPLSNIHGLLNYLTTEISSSKQRKFPMVTFIDTPGLVDGQMAYPFDVDQAILWFGHHVDLIFVLFDPIGQALCKRTLNLVEKLNKFNPEKMHYYLAKADEAGTDRDRHRVLMQIVQNLCRQPEISKTSFDMPTIYLPDLAKETRCTNQINEVCTTIDHAVFSGVQKSLNTLQLDCKNLIKCITDKLSSDGVTRYHQRRWNIKLYIFQLFSILFLFLSSLLFIRRHVISWFNDDTSAIPSTFAYLSILETVFTRIGNGFFYPSDHLLLLFAFINLLLFFLGQFFLRRQSPVLSSREQKLYSNYKHYLETNVLVKEKELYESFLSETID